MWFVLWLLTLRYAEPSASLIIYMLPLGIVLFALGPLDLLPERWPTLNFCMNAIATGLFFVSLMFATAALSFELPWEKGARTVFCFSGWAIELFVFHKALPWIKKSPFHRLGEDRIAYSPPVDRQGADRD
ncbi:hypothetical protein [Pseudomonas sp.]|uniref:hypothetical protein n=1 Tax=Pseudomonas sp. TaxID=306 RepID=UPI0028B0977A|nr:hypothetical protein [Pseudomonas sp.]